MAITLEQADKNAMDLALWANERYGGDPKQAVLALTQVLAEYLKVMSAGESELAHNYATTCMTLNKWTHQKNILLALSEDGNRSKMK